MPTMSAMPITCSLWIYIPISRHVLSYHHDKYHLSIQVYCVNDGAVMNAWGIDQKIEGSMITFMGDPSGEFTKALKMELTHPGPASIGIIGRSKRFAMYLDNSVIKYVAVSEGPDDPAGDTDPSTTCHVAMLKAIKECA
jgi:2-Cys peroxiredoxin 5